MRRCAFISQWRRRTIFAPAAHPMKRGAMRSSRSAASFATSEVMRDEQPTRPLERLAHNVRFALRMLRKTPGFTFAAVLTLAVGIGGNTAVFSAVNGVLLHPLPYPNADRLVTIAHTTKGGGIPKNLPGSSATYVAYSPAKSFESPWRCTSRTR